MALSDARARLAEFRAAFRAHLEHIKAARLRDNFSGRTALVLSGGGGRGAYQAGVLLAFQDAQLPTHILTATSVGSLNAASYAAHSDTLVGNAEPLVDTWLELTPPVVGIEWTRYAWMLAGLIAASAGFGNLIRYALDESGFSIQLHDPALTWLALGLAGMTVLLLFDRLPYIGYVIQSFFRQTTWNPDRRKAALSLLANLVVWGFLLLVLHSLYIPTRLGELVRFHPWVSALLAAVLLVLAVLHRRWRAPVSGFLHWLLRLPLRSGLFANFERRRLLRRGASMEKLRASPIRVLFTTTDLEAGTARFFTSTPIDQLAADPGADMRFIAAEVARPDDLARAVIASSALPLIYEPITLAGRLYTDGALVANQPIRPAIRLGADVLFLVMTDPPASKSEAVNTFLDVGLRALDILMEQNLLTDLKTLNNVNAACERGARELGLHPEEVEIDLGAHRYRYVKAFSIRPTEALEATMLEFSRETASAAILRGYRDARAQIEDFFTYAEQSRFGRPKRVLRFVAQASAS